MFSGLEKFSNTEFLAAISITLAEHQEKAEQNEAALESLKQAKQILEENYSSMDKRTCKVKRNISLLYLKLNNYSEALDELKQVEVSSDHVVLTRSIGTRDELVRGHVTQSRKDLQGDWNFVYYSELAS